MEGLDRPTSLEIINNTTYTVTLGGESWKIDNIAGAAIRPAAQQQSCDFESRALVLSPIPLERLCQTPALE